MLLLARSSILESPLEIEYQIDKLERFFSLVGQLACGVFITGRDCHLINHPEQCKRYTWDRAISNAGQAYASFSQVEMWFHSSWRFIGAARPPYSRPQTISPPTPPKLLTFSVCPLVSHATIMPLALSVALVQRRVYLAATRKPAGDQRNGEGALLVAD